MSATVVGPSGVKEYAGRVVGKWFTVSALPDLDKPKHRYACVVDDKALLMVSEYRLAYENGDTFPIYTFCLYDPTDLNGACKQHYFGLEGCWSSRSAVVNQQRIHGVKTAMNVSVRVMWNRQVLSGFAVPISEASRIWPDYDLVGGDEEASYTLKRKAK